MSYVIYYYFTYKNSNFHVVFNLLLIYISKLQVSIAIVSSQAFVYTTVLESVFLRG